MAYPDTPVNLTQQAPVGPYTSLPLDALEAGIVMTACDAVEGNQFTGDGKQILLLQNTGATARTVTITSVADPATLRTGDVTAYSIPAGGLAMFSFAKQTSIKGWSLAGLATGKVRFLANNAEVKAAVIGPVTAL